MAPIIYAIDACLIYMAKTNLETFRVEFLIVAHKLVCDL